MVSSTRSLEIEDTQAVRTLGAALLFSFLLHAALLFFTLERPKLSEPILVSLLDPPKKAQIVSPSQAPEKEPDKPTQQLSDRDSSVPVEQIRRGQIDGSGTADDPKISQASAPQAVAKPQSSPARQNKPRQPKSAANLRLKDERLLASLAAGTKAPTKTSSQEPTVAEAQQQLRNHPVQSEYRPFSSSRLMLGSRGGTPDFLPQIRDGDVTLLNAKAYRFAVFVRRVAHKVFGALRRHSWQELPPSAINRIRDFVMVKAILSPKGELISVELTDSSGSTPFDKVVVSAARDGAWDKNPPPGVHAADGNIHFVFKSKSWSRGSRDGIREQRWILLGTGLL